MIEKKPIFVIESNGFAASQIMSLLKRMVFDVDVHVVEKKPNAADSTVIELSKPYRMGSIVDRISGHLRGKDENEDILNMGAGRYVDKRLGLFFPHKKAEPLRLTEKEVALLSILFDAHGKSIPREQLLDDVWQYAEGVETHTLETHIYRLRQKIEIDPAEPKILQTNDSGYFLSIE